MPIDTSVPAHRFVPEGLDAGDLTRLEPLFDALLQRQLDSTDEVERWLLDESELRAAFAAELARRYIEMTCHTDRDDARDAYLRLERDVAPRVKVLQDRLDRKLLDSPGVAGLGDRYSVMLRRRRTAREIFREANTELEAREAELQTRQQELMATLTVEFDGREHTPQQMAPYLEETDRDRRERAWRATMAARATTWQPLHEILDELVALRTRMARNAGFDTYTPYRFLQLQRFDYGPEDCMHLHDAIATAVVPAVQRIDERRRQRLGIERLRPWDLEVDPGGRSPLRPFNGEQELVDIVRRTFAAIDSRFADEFEVLRRERLLDLMSRKGKAPGGYQYTLEDVRLPFIFMNAVGTHRDVQTMLHEGGHAVHALLSRSMPLVDDRDPPIEFAETASMSMELLGLERIAVVYGDDDARRARGHHLETVLRLLPWIASIDAFQHWLYGNPEHGHDERQQAWLDIRARLATGVDYSGLEDALAHQWTGQPHLYNYPLYYIEYAIAQLAALQVWRHYREDPVAAVEAYRDGLALGGTRPLGDLFAAANVRFDLSESMLRELVAEVESVL